MSNNTQQPLLIPLFPLMGNHSTPLKRGFKCARKTLSLKHSFGLFGHFLSQGLTQLVRQALRPWICHLPALAPCVPGSTGLHLQAPLSSQSLATAWQKPVSTIPLHKHEAQTNIKQERVIFLKTPYYTGDTSSFLSEDAKKKQKQKQNLVYFCWMGEEGCFVLFF